MNNEPVAWMNPNESSIDYKFSDECAGDWNIPLYTHLVKELDEQFEKGFKAGKEEGWKAHKFHHPVKEQDESFDRTASHMAGEYVSYKAELTDEEIEDECRKAWGLHDQDQLNLEEVFKFARAILRKAQEK